MTKHDLDSLQPGDKVRFKRGFQNAGSTATVKQRRSIVSYRDKPWYRPPSYTDPKTESAEPGPADSEPGAVDLPRSTGGRESVKPVGGQSRDTTPLHYRRARPDKNVIDLDDDDDPSDDQEQPPDDQPFE